MKSYTLNYKWNVIMRKTHANKYKNLLNFFFDNLHDLRRRLLVFFGQHCQHVDHRFTVEGQVCQCSSVAFGAVSHLWSKII